MFCQPRESKRKIQSGKALWGFTGERRRDAGTAVEQ